MRIYHHLTTLLLCGLFSVSPVSAETLQGRLQAVPFELRQDNPSVATEVEDASLMLTAPTGSDLYTSANTAPRVTFMPEGDFIFSARIDAPTAADFDGGALVIYADETRWAKLLYERIQVDSHVVSSTVALPTGDGGYHTRLGAQSKPVWLKIVRIGASVRFYMSEDGVDWHILRDFRFEGEARVGFLSQAPRGAPLRVVFSDIRFEEKTAKNYWQGQ